MTSPSGRRDLSLYLLGRDVSAGRALKNLGNDAQQTHSRLGRMAGFVGGALKRSFLIGGAAVTGMGIAGVTMGIKTAASMEQADVAFTTLLGGAKKAKSYLADLSSFAARTPFEFPGLVDDSRLLLGVGVSAKQVIPTLTDFGDAAGALGIQQDSFNRIMLATTQSIAAGKIKLGDMNQLMNNGLPIWKLLSEALDKPVAKIQNMISHGKLMADDVLPKLRAQMHKDYGGAMERQSKTLSGEWSTLMDTINLGMASVLKPAIPLIKRGVAGAIGVLGDVMTGLPKVAKPAFDKVGDIIGKAKKTVGPPARELGHLVMDNLLPKAADFASRTSSFVTGLLGSVDDALHNGDYGALGATMADGIVTAIKGSGDVAMKATEAFGSMLDKIDWVQVGVNAGKFTLPFVAGVISGIVGYIGSPDMIKDVAHHWQLFLFTILALAFTPERAITRIGELLARIPIVGKLAQWGLKWSADASKKFVGFFLDVGKGAVKGLYRGFAKEFPSVERFIVGKVGGLGKNLKGFFGFFFDIGRGIVDEFVGGIRAVPNKVPAAGEWIARKLIGVFKDARTWLVNAGKAVLQGFLDGLKSKWEDVKSFVGGVGGWISDHKGPIEKDRKLLTPHGRAIMDGLVQGIKSRQGSLANAVGRLVDFIRSHLSELPKAARDQMRNAVRALNDGLHDYERLLNRRTTILDRISSTRSSARSFAGGISGGLIGAADLTNMNGPVGTQQIVHFLRRQNRGLRGFRRDLRRLRDRGVSARIINQLAAAGVESGGAIAHALAIQAGRGDIAQINRLSLAIGRNARAIGQSRADARYGDKLDKQLDALHDIKREIRSSRSQIIEITNKVYLDGKEITSSTDRHQRRRRHRKGLPAESAA